MKQIGILTTHRANNFGAVLQAYSLVNACREIGTHAKIIDWRGPFYEWQYHRLLRITRNPISICRHFFWHLLRERYAYRLFESFRQRLPLTRPIKTGVALRKSAVAFDRFIVGSDQVWNPLNSALMANRFDRAFLLDFVGNRSRNAYAASIGVESIEPEVVRREFMAAWRRYDYISMREYAGAEYVSSLINRSVETVLDPVLLHDESWWRNLVKRGSLPDEFVFEYNVRGVEALDAFAERIGMKRGIKVVRPLIPSFSWLWQREAMSMGPAEFVSAIAYSDCVVTSSFHAAAFSVIFGKKLFLIRRKTMKDPNSRFTTLFRFAGLTESIVVEDKQYFIVEVDCSRVDFEALQKERMHSIACLCKMCGNDQ